MNYNHELLKVKDLETLKKLYYQYAKVLHPDHGGTKAAFQELQEDYSIMFNKVKNIHVDKNGATYEKTTAESVNDFTDVINELLSTPGLQIDIVGSFIWIGGNTKAAKDLLKKLGFKWSPNKKLWYRSPAGYRKKSKKSFTYADIVNKYGIQSSIKTGAGAGAGAAASRLYLH